MAKKIAIDDLRLLYTYFHLFLGEILASHEIRTVDIFEKIIYKRYGEKVNSLVSKLKIIEDFALSLDDICDGEFGVTVATKLIDSLSKLMKLDEKILNILSEKGKAILKEEIKGHKLAEELETTTTLGSALSLLIEGYETRACLAKLYNYITKNLGFDVDEFEVKNIVAAYFMIDDIKDIEKDGVNGSPNFVLSLVRNKNLDPDSKTLLLEIVFLHFLENIYDNDFAQELIKKYREHKGVNIMFEEAYFEKVELKSS